jgi:3',5'-cyclic AMP phosphodiesterase CpdA
MSAFPFTSLVHLTDLHIRRAAEPAHRRVDTAAYLRKSVDMVRRLAPDPDAVVITGNLTDFGQDEAYAHLAQLLSPLAVPVYLLPGSHDSREALRRGFPGHAHLGDGPFIQYGVDVGALRLIAVDSCVPGESHGALCRQRLRWLSDQLDASGDRPVVLAMHHPPFATHVNVVDKPGLLHGAEELEDLVERHPNIERIVSGHLHQAVTTLFGGAVAMTAPAPAQSMRLDDERGRLAQWEVKPPAFLVHAFPGTGRMVSHTVSSVAL